MQTKQHEWTLEECAQKSQQVSALATYTLHLDVDDAVQQAAAKLKAKDEYRIRVLKALMRKHAEKTEPTKGGGIRVARHPKTGKLMWRTDASADAFKADVEEFIGNKAHKITLPLVDGNLLLAGPERPTVAVRMACEFLFDPVPWAGEQEDLPEELAQFDEEEEPEPKAESKKAA